MNLDNKSKLFVPLVGILIAILLVNVYLVGSLDSTLEKKKIQAEVAAIPAKVQLMVLTTPCPTCFDINGVVAQVEATGVNVTQKVTLDSTSQEGTALIEKYGVTRLPSLIIQGEVDKSPSLQKVVSEVGVPKDGAVVLSALSPPFVDPKTGAVRGEVTLIYLTKEDCVNCYNLTLLVNQLKETLKVKDFKVVSVNSPQGRVLLDKYSITAVPTVLFDNEASVYPVITEVWNFVGTVEKDGSYVMRNINPPYYNLSSNKVEGIVDLTIIEDKSCTGCFDAGNTNKAILAQMGVVFGEETRVDSSSNAGKVLVDRYKITKIPTVILTGDVSVYQALTQSWTSVGSVERDGSYVLRRLEVFEQPYKDLTTNKIVTVQPAATPSQ